MAFRVGVIAGEASGDLLGAGLVAAIRSRYPEALFEGVAGPAMLAAGVTGWLPMERLSVMGLAEVVRHLPELLRIRRGVLNRFLAVRPDVVIGIDSPDFNLAIETRLRAAGIRTVQYVSPTVWAWRPGRMKGIARAVDLVLCLYPFEADLYKRHAVPAVFVGHPLADAIPTETDGAAARAALGVEGDAELVALLPGSRAGEVQRLGSEFVAAAAALAARRPTIRFVAAMATPAVRRIFEAALRSHGGKLPVTLVDGRAREVMAAADVVLLASGTATLEAALLKRPMVVAYRVSETTRRIVRTFRLMKIRRFALPNLLAGEDVVPELLQEDATAERMVAELLPLLDDDGARRRQVEQFEAIHRQLRRGADRRAADAVLALCGRLPGSAP
jgi:lipid-A-disaccharide synthase